MSSKELIRPLTALRFYAAFLVFSIHASMLPGLQWLGHVGSDLQGKIGVSVFFVLSGFIMTYVYYGEDRYEPSRVSGGRFIIARLTRIYPLHILTMLISLPLGLNSPTAPVDPAALPYHLLLLQEFSPFGYLGDAPNKVSWTLSCEMFFYLMTPLVFTLMIRTKKFKAWTVGILFLIVSAATVLFMFYPDIHEERAMFRWSDYLLGILAFLFFQKAQLNIRPWMKWLMPLGILWFCFMMYGEYHWWDELPTTLMLLPGSVAIVLGTGFLRNTKSWFLASDRMVFLGEASFAFYMVHEFILRYSRVVLMKIGFEIHWLLYIPWMVFVFIVIQWVAIQFHVRFEMPMQENGRRWLFKVFRLDKKKVVPAAAR